MRGTRLAIHDQVTRSPTRAGPASDGTSSGNSNTTTIGVIFNVSSLAAQFALLNQPLYGASKAGVSSFSRSLAPLHGIKSSRRRPRHGQHAAVDRAPGQDEDRQLE